MHGRATNTDCITHTINHTCPAYCWLCPRSIRILACETESHGWGLQEDSCPDYMLKAEDCLKAEEARVASYLHINSKAKLMTQVLLLQPGCIVQDCHRCTRAHEHTSSSSPKVACVLPDCIPAHGPAEEGP